MKSWSLWQSALNFPGSELANRRSNKNYDSQTYIDAKQPRYVASCSIAKRRNPLTSKLKPRPLNQTRCQASPQRVRTLSD